MSTRKPGRVIARGGSVSAMGEGVRAARGVMFVLVPGEDEPTERTVDSPCRGGHDGTTMTPSKHTVYLLASGDLRLSANQKCWPAQAEMETALVAAFATEGWELIRAHAFDPVKQHGFIDSQKRGMEIFNEVPAESPVVVAEAVWQYSHHVLAGLATHRGPILTVANWSGTWPGLVGMLNLNGSLTKAGVRYSTLWSEDFTDEFFRRGLRRWLRKGRVKHQSDHVQKLAEVGLEEPEADAARLGRTPG